MTKRQAKRWICEECRSRYTTKQAADAMRNGCDAGCSGIDVRQIDDTDDIDTPTPNGSTPT